MTNKKRRQRGSRTHGGGTQKNRRGAGNRGGRGAAGRKKHEFHQYGSLGKHGFTRPEEITDSIAETDVRTLDENAALWVADGLAETTDEGYRIDARDVVEDGYDVDAVKVLGDGQVRNQLEVVADAFSETAIELLEAAGGEAILSERGQALAEEAADDEDEDEAETDTDNAPTA